MARVLELSEVKTLVSFKGNFVVNNVKEILVKAQMTFKSKTYLVDSQKHGWRMKEALRKLISLIVTKYISG